MSLKHVMQMNLYRCRERVSPEVACWNSNHWVDGSNQSGAYFVINLTSLSHTSDIPPCRELL